VSAAAWLRARRPEAPAELLEAAVQAVAAAGPGPAGEALSEQLARAGGERLRAALAFGDERAGAFALLVADALLTWACEAAAEEGEHAVARLAAAWTPARISRLRAGAQP
jgi:hypothetical protein